MAVEITPVMGCRYCLDFWKLCPNLDRLERRENDLHYQIARLGGV